MRRIQKDRWGSLVSDDLETRRQPRTPTSVISVVGLKNNKPELCSDQFWLCLLLLPCVSIPESSLHLLALSPASCSCSTSPERGNSICVHTHVWTGTSFWLLMKQFSNLSAFRPTNQIERPLDGSSMNPRQIKYVY